MYVAAIVNPVSGSGMDPSVIRRRVSLLRDALEQKGVRSDIRVTERGGHAGELAAEAAAAGASLVIVWGGDGTINEAGAALVGTSTPIGVVPAGSGNGLAAALEVPRDPESAIAATLSGRTRAIDVGMLNGRPFFNIAGIGFDAHIAELFNQRRRGSRGRWPYVAIGVREGCRYCSQEYVVTLDGKLRTLTALLIAFANGREYGMGARIAPGARLDDGLLEATIVEDRPVLARFWHTRYLATGAIHRAPRVLMQQVRSASVEAAETLQFHVDGEPGIATGRVEIAIMPGALRVAG